MFPKVLTFVLFFKFNFLSNKPTVKKSLYGKPNAISFISSGIFSSFISTIKSLSGIEDINMSPENTSIFPSKTHSTETILFSFTFTFCTECFFRIFPPLASISLARVSHNCPGPYFGYQNCSIRDVSTSLLFGLKIFLNISFITAVIDTPLTL